MRKGKVIHFIVVVVVNTKIASSRHEDILASDHHCHNVENGKKNDNSLLQSI